MSIAQDIKDIKKELKRYERLSFDGTYEEQQKANFMIKELNRRLNIKTKIFKIKSHVNKMCSQG
jgi:hypothetical protein